MNGLPLAIIISLLVSAGCFKKTHLNENALLHQRACIESINLNDYLRAQTHCELCLEYDASMPECLNGMGLIHRMNKDEERALSFFSKAVRQDNEYSHARNNIGAIYFERGDFPMALRYFDRALEIDPSNTDARYNAGLSHFRLGQRALPTNAKESIKHFHQAKDLIKKLLAIEPTYLLGFRDLGLINLNLYALNEYAQPRTELLDEAKRAFMQCIESKTDQDGCYEGLGQVFYEEGRYDQSFANYFLCLSFASNNAACREGIVMAYEKSAQTHGGYQNFKQAVGQDLANAYAHEAFCAALFERGLDGEAVKECEIAVRLKPGLCGAQFRLAEYYTATLHGERAVSHCQAFLRCDQTNPQHVAKCQEVLATMKR